IANPMLLTAMCIVYGEGKRLPQDKHNLYERIVDNVLFNRYPNDRAQIEPIRARLSVIADGMQTGERLGLDWATPHAEITCSEIDKILEHYRDSMSWHEEGLRNPTAVREDLLENSGLLLPRPDNRAAFYHLTFQDFLAAPRFLARENHRLLEAFRL